MNPTSEFRLGSWSLPCLRKLLVTVVCPVLVAALCACVEVASEAVVSAVTATSAIVSGEVTDDASNDDLPRGILYSKKAINPNPFLGGAGVDFKLSDGTGEGVFEVLLTGLEPDTEYVARAFAPEDGKETSKPVYFTTLSGEGLDSYPLTFDGKEVKGTSGRFSDVMNPATGEVIARVPLATPAELDAAVQSAAKAQLVTIFDSLKPNDPIALKGRRRLSSLVFA